MKGEKFLAQGAIVNYYGPGNAFQGGYVAIQSKRKSCIESIQGMCFPNDTVRKLLSRLFPSYDSKKQ